MPKKTKKPPSPPTISTCYICSECAVKQGGTWPLGHVATFHAGICPCCGQTGALAEIHDWENVEVTFLDGSKCRSSRYKREF